jgi:outer membrane protein assembly factor BamB
MLYFTKNSRVLAAIIIMLFASAFVWFVSTDPVGDIERRVPGMDDRPELISENDSVVIGEFYEAKDISTNLSGSNWPRFRGSDFDNISKDLTPIISDWPDEGPVISWQIKLGEGHAGPAIHNGRVYVLDYDEKIRADVLRCLSFETGEEIWKRWYNVAIKRNHGMSRTIPAVNDDFIITIGPRCHVMCVETSSGDLLWSLDLVRDYGAEIPQWYTAQCPLIDDNIAVIAVGGESLMMGVDCNTGEIKWETKNPDLWKMSHSSIVPATIHGQKTYIYMAVGGICGIAADGDNVGSVLWKTSDWSPAVVATSPIYLGNNQIAFTTGYGAGGGKIEIVKTGSDFEARIIETHTPKEGLASEQQTPILTGAYLWTINPKDAGALRNQLTCYHISDLLNPVWASGKENRYGLGPYMLVGDKLFLVNDDAELFMFNINTNSVSLLDSFNPFTEGIDAWGPLAFADGFLIMRDSHDMICLDLRQTTYN